MVHTIVLKTHTPRSKLKSKIQLLRARVHIQLEPNPSGRTYKKTIFLENLKNTAERYRLFKEPSLQAIARIEASLLSGARKYFEENLFVEVTVPHVTRATGRARTWRRCSRSTSSVRSGTSRRRGSSTSRS